MTRNAIYKLAATGLIAAIGIGGPTATVMASDGDMPQVNPARAARSADKANQAMERGRLDRALRFAEEAVAMAPSDPSYRALLGQAYLASGRFASAEASFDAARELGATDSRTIIGHALTMIATGRANDALALVEANASTLPASDFGLALALAGQAERGVMILTDVVRADDATPRDRQNLALSYAFAGRWLEARLIAAQDVGPARVGDRMTEWAAMVQTGDPRQRIAGLIGTQIAEDPGMPVRLALRDAPRVMAMADPAPLAQYAPPPPTDSEALVDELLAETVPVAEAAPVAMAAAPVEESAPAATGAVASNGVVYVSNPIVQPLRSLVAMVAPLANDAPAAAPAQSRPVRTTGRVAAAAVAAPIAEAAPAAAPAPQRLALGPVRTSGWAVQLGAYDSVGVARDGWARVARRHAAALNGRDGVSTSATVNGRTVYRLSVTGFDNRAEAAAGCAAIAAQGGQCFVRQIAPSEPVRWASRTAPTRVAAR